MKKFKFANPLDALSERDFDKLRQLEECSNLDFLKAVEILGLDPKADFRFSDLADVDLSRVDFSRFDLTGSNLNGCFFHRDAFRENLIDAANAIFLPHDHNLASSSAMSQSTTGDRIAIGYLNGIVQMWTPDGQKVLWDSLISDVPIKRLRFAGGSADELLVVYSNGRGCLLSAFDGSLIALYDVPGVRLLNHAFDATVERLVGCRDNFETVFVLEDGSEIATFKGHSDWVLSAEADLRTARLLTASSDGTIRLWDINSRSEVMRVDLVSDRAEHLEFSPDESAALTVSKRGLAQVWDLETGYEIARCPRDHGQLTSARYVSEESVLVCTDQSKLLLWSVETGAIEKLFHTSFIARLLAGGQHHVCVGGDEGQLACLPISFIRLAQS